MLKIYRALALIASLGAVVLWVGFSLTSPYGSQGLMIGAHIIAVAMILLALVGSYAAWQYNSLLMMGVFILSFFPVGLYLLGTSGIFMGIGVFNLLYFAATLLNLSWQQREEKTQSQV
jgi:hypothetical protein